MIGTVDALLTRVNEKLSLNIRERDINAGSVNRALNRINRSEVLADSDKVSCSTGSWFWLINDLRNFIRNLLIEIS